MNIIGIGIRRDRHASDRRRCCSVTATVSCGGSSPSGEIAYCTRRRDPVPHLAGRFAAKEAAMKALGTGHSRGVLWKDIEVVRAAVRRNCGCTAAPPRRAESMHVRRSLVTITHAETVAIAQVMLLGD